MELNPFNKSYVKKSAFYNLSLYIITLIQKNAKSVMEILKKIQRHVSTIIMIASCYARVEHIPLKSFILKDGRIVGEEK